MKKFYSLLIAGLWLSTQVWAVSVQDVCGRFDNIYVLPGALSGTVTIVVTDADIPAGTPTEIVLPNIPMNEDGELDLTEAPVYLPSLSEHVTASVTSSALAADRVALTLSLTRTSQAEPVVLELQGAASTNNYLLHNGGFEGEWAEVIPMGMKISLGGTEPDGWHSFASADGLLYMFVIGNGFQFVASNEARPASAGTQSALISSNLIFGQKANGNCTNGRVYAGSMTPDDPEGNYNYSDPDSTGFNTPFHGRPDSIVFYAKYLPADRDYTNEVNKARMKAVITTDARYQDPEPGESIAERKIAAAEINYAATPELGWQRLAVPFEYTDIDPQSAAYILVTFSTNMTPGGGSSYRDSEKGVNVLDSVYVDDVRLVYNRRLLRVTKGAEELSFDGGVAALSENYCDDCAPYTAQAEGASARTFTAFDAQHKCIFIYVLADDYAQTTAYSLYRVEFADTDYDPQGVETIRPDSSNATKVLRQGAFYIVRDNVWYDATGKRMTK